MVKISRIVPAFNEGSMVTVPRTLADIVVSEYGICPPARQRPTGKSFGADCRSHIRTFAAELKRQGRGDVLAGVDYRRNVVFRSSSFCLKKTSKESEHYGSINVTTSWDDGSVIDLRLGALLTKYGMEGTFYIPNYSNRVNHAGKG